MKKLKKCKITFAKHKFLDDFGIYHSLACLNPRVAKKMIKLYYARNIF